MTEATVLRLGVVGCGHIATEQVVKWQTAGRVDVVAGVEPNAPQFDRFAKSFPTPPVQADSLEALLADLGEAVDAIYIATPHAFHAEQAKTALLAGKNVLLEKPMAFDLADARAIEAAAETSGATLVVAFNGSLSPHLRVTSEALAAGEFGQIHTISALVSENWAGLYDGHWKQNPEISGGGFLLDSGSHALNAIIDVAGCGIESVSAQFSEKKPGVEISAALSGRMQNGALVSLTACGDTAPPCLGQLTLFCETAVLTVDPWGKRATIVRDASGERELSSGPARQLIDLFIDVCAGRIENPSPIARNIEFARLWAATRQSAANAGQPVTIQDMEG
jgi:predicted dehydrogenase